MKDVELVIIGAGPGGMAAAIEAAKAGVNAVLLDENRRSGGRIYWQFNDGFNVTDSKVLGPDYERGKRLLTEFAAHGDKIEYLEEALVFGLFDNRELAFQRSDKFHSLRHKTLIVAIGAYDRPVPFPGWTLPGVFTAGGAQGFIKMQRVLPGKNILLAGTGPLQLVLAKQILDAGGRVEAVLEAGDVDTWSKVIRGAWGIWGNWELLTDAWHYWRGIRKAGVPLCRKHIILEAHGDGQVEEAVIAKVNRDWRPKAHTRCTIKVDTICLGYGFIPSVEITRLAGCEHRYELHLGGWFPVRRENMETSVPGVYAVGDASGVAGSHVAVQEGRIAGVSAAHSLGYISAGEAKKRIEPFRKRLECLRRLRHVLDDISMPKPGLYEPLNDDTIICRCEEITWGEIKNAIHGGFIEINEIKRITRFGMGRCQGRMCGPSVQEILAKKTGVPPAEVGYLNPRPPVKPVSLGVLAKYSEEL